MSEGSATHTWCDFSEPWAYAFANLSQSFPLLDSSQRPDWNDSYLDPLQVPEHPASPGTAVKHYLFIPIGTAMAINK